MSHRYWSLFWSNTIDSRPYVPMWNNTEAISLKRKVPSYPINIVSLACLMYVDIVRSSGKRFLEAFILIQMTAFPSLKEHRMDHDPGTFLRWLFKIWIDGLHIKKAFRSITIPWWKISPLVEVDVSRWYRQDLAYPQALVYRRYIRGSVGDQRSLFTLIRDGEK